MFGAIVYDPLVSIDVGPLSLSPHGIFTAIGLLVGSVFLLRDVERAGFDGEAVSQILFRSIGAALVGARLAYVVNHPSKFDSPLEVLRLWEGGASLLGGLTAAFVVAVFELRRRKMPVLRLLDLAAPWLPLGIAVGRIGDLIIADHLGDPTGLPFGYRCPDVVDVGETVGSPCPAGEVVHLSAAYDMVWAAVVVVLVLRLRRRFERPGMLIGATAALYGTGRFVLDITRADDLRFGLSGSQWTALAMIAVGVTVLVRARRIEAADDEVEEPVPA